MKLSIAASALLLTSTSALGADCSALVKSIGNSGWATLVTLNNRNVASYFSSSVVHADAIKTPQGLAIPPRLMTPTGNGIDNPGIGPQLFSDRRVGSQPFDVNKPDSLGLAITDTNPVVVTVTLQSWGNAKATFTPTCEDGGFMRGVTPDVLYTLRLSK
jgi:hypothetical protein